jgi:exosortase family protein XrtF
MLKEFKPSFVFLAKFLGIYFVGNVLYGLYIESFGQKADHITFWVTQQTALLLNILGIYPDIVPNPHGPSVFLKEHAVTMLSVFEGCNGINIIIIFVAFVIAFGGPVKKMAWFIPLGIFIVHLSNLLRIWLLYFVSKNYQHYFYYVHKYFFTAILYLVIFALWTFWVIRFNGKSNTTGTTATHPG